MTILVGTSSWTDPTLTRDSDFYPSPSMTAEERLRHYASLFPVVEVDATYYAPPARSVSELWVERTPAGFRMDVKAYGLLTGHPARPKTLWADLRDELPAEVRDKRSVYAHHLSGDLLEEAWARFADGLRPLAEAGKLGAVVFQMPPWFTAKRANREALAELGDRLPGWRKAVELRHGSWFADSDGDRTLALLEEHDLTYVCVDEPQGFPTSVPPVVAATAELAMVRFHGHNADNWQKKDITPAERFRYLYGEDELRGWVDPIRQLDATATETHALMNNCYRDYGVRNAQDLGRLLGQGLQHPG